MGVKPVKLAKCSVCRKVPEPTCDWRQGRCPHRPSIIDISVINRVKNFFKFIKGNE